MKTLNLLRYGVIRLTNEENKETDGGILFPPIGLGIMAAEFEYIGGIIEGYNDAVN